MNFAKFLKAPFYMTPPGDCFWFRTSSVEVTGSNEGITVMIDVIIPQKIKFSIRDFFNKCDQV